MALEEPPRVARPLPWRVHSRGLREDRRQAGCRGDKRRRVGPRSESAGKAGHLRNELARLFPLGVKNFG
jgi:hypothetical protein